MTDQIKVIVETTKTGFSAYTNKYPVYTTGKDMKELKKNMLEAMNFYVGNANRYKSKDIQFELK